MPPLVRAHVVDPVSGREVGRRLRAGRLGTMLITGIAGLGLISVMQPLARRRDGRSSAGTD